LPEIDSGIGWVAWIKGCGFCLISQHGPIPLTFQEIEAWQKSTRQELSGFEAETIRKLSEHYCSMYQRSTSPVFPDPCRSEDAAARTMQAFQSLVKRYQ
jgi:hypothetical protein